MGLPFCWRFALAATRKMLVTPINRLAAAAGDFVQRRERADGARRFRTVRYGYKG
ncbi:MAG: hypothetical protein ACLSB9_18690 [Hydrogeniiclostridium mannosilyticum]